MPAGPASPSPSPRSGRSPLEGTERLVVDGTNLLYRIGPAASPSPSSPSRPSSSAAPAPPAAVVGRLRASIPAAISIDLVFDGAGHGVFGRVAQGMVVRYAGRRTADDVILDLASEAAIARPGKATADRVLVVTNDRELRTRLHAKGARTVPLQWLLERLDVPVLASPASGNKRAPIGAGRAPGGAGTAERKDADGTDERPGWKPGRRATTKVGPPRKVARHKRHPRHGA